MMELNLQEIRQIEIDILKHFKNVCDSNNIKFFVSNGTLLGAIKYSGFIPWDDDIDVLVPREDYDFLIKNYTDTKKYRLYSNERCDDFYFPFAKLCDSETRKEEIGIDNGIITGVDIDIFPLDIWPNNLNKAKKDIYKIDKSIKRLNLSKLPLKKGQNIFRTFIKGVIIIGTKCVGARKYIKKIQKIGLRNRGIETNKYKGCVMWPIYGDNEIIPREVFNGTIDVVFEGEIFPAPIGYDTYLRSLYGDYEKDPPKEKQKTHHNFKAYRIV